MHGQGYQWESGFACGAKWNDPRWIHPDSKLVVVGGASVTEAEALNEFPAYDPLFEFTPENIKADVLLLMEEPLNPE